MIRWVRHGQSTWNAVGRLQGHTAHPPLTELGRDQAAAAAEALAALDVVRLLSSPTVRARQTAEIIGDRLGQPIEIEPLLVEQGHDETEQQVALRMRRLLRDPASSRPTVAVTHGDTIRVALGLLGAPSVAVPGNGTVTWVDPHHRVPRTLEPSAAGARAACSASVARPAGSGWPGG